MEIKKMKLPFSVEQFLGIFQVYNNAIWPMQILLNLLALIAIILAIRKASVSSKIVSAILGFLWLWTGVVYHWIYFSSINNAAYVFGTLCVVQGLIFFFTGVYRSSLSFRFQSNVQGIIGGIFVLYALFIYPVLGYLLEHIYPASPTFGAPCPTTIFTFGLLLWTDKIFPRYILAIPLLWSIIGFTAALSLTIREDFGLLIAGLLGTLLILLRRDRQIKA
jgi:hypothetical protein